MSHDRRKPRVGIVSRTLGHVPDSHRLSTREALDAVGHNTGNLAFRYAVARHVGPPAVHVPWGSSPGWVREVCDLLLIPSSNQVNPSSDFSDRAVFIEAVDLPCLAVGLGAQAPTLGADLRLPAGTLRYIRAVAERSRSVGVRGTYTAEVLSGLGVKNAVVIGCPSHFINPSPELGTVIQRKLRRGSPVRLVMTDVELVPSQRALGRKLFTWVVEGDGEYVCQSHPALIGLARNRSEDVTEEEVDRFRHELLPPSASLSRPSAGFRVLAGGRMRVFFDVGAWLEYLSAFDLSIGVRFHGNSLAVQAGTPGVCIPHDSRTQELCDTTGLPGVSGGTLMEARSPGEVTDAVAFDGGDFDARRAALARDYRRILEESGVAVAGPLCELTEARTRHVGDGGRRADETNLGERARAIGRHT